MSDDQEKATPYDPIVEIRAVEIVPRGPFLGIKDDVVMGTVARPSFDRTIDREIRNAAAYVFHATRHYKPLYDAAKAVCINATRFKGGFLVSHDDFEELCRHIKAGVNIK